MPARNAARTVASVLGAMPSGSFDEIILVDDKSTDDTVEAGALAAGPPDLASAQRRLRRQSEDLLPGGPPARRRHRHHAAPRRPVRARDPAANGAADHRRRSRHGAGLALRRTRRGDRRRHAAVEVPRQSLSHGDREPRPRHRPERASHRLSGLLARAAADDPVPAQLARLQLRFRGDHAGGPLRLSDRRGPGPQPLLRRRILGDVQARRRLRAQDSVVRACDSSFTGTGSCRRASFALSR